jgi:ribonuclease HII
MGCSLRGLLGGIDEAGRGPLAGPVVASCVIWRGLPEQRAAVADSKLLSAKERSTLFPWIREHAYRIGIGVANHEEIDRLNILRASLLSMERALEDTGIHPDLLLIDGNFGIESYPSAKAVVRGDRKCFFVACASIVAKVVRDGIMEMYHSFFPDYNFKQNKGYPTAGHRQTLKIYGPSPIHRRTFKGVKDYLDV